MPTINTLLNGVNNIDYSSLQNLSNGTYNKGEIDLKRGLFGKYSFDKINNHVGYYADKNTEVRTAEQNLKTKAAVFKAILTRFAGRDEAARVANVLGSEDRNEIMNLLEDFHNPYIKEAYVFLLSDGAALTRDEMRYLDSLLLEGVNGQQVQQAKVDVLNRLRDVKSGQSTDTSGIERWIKGLSVKNLSGTKEARVMGVSANVLANTNAEYVDQTNRVIAKYMPELYNACLENVMKIPEGFGSRPAKSSDVLEFMHTLLNGIADKITTGMKVYRQARAEGKATAAVTAENIREKAIEYIKNVLFSQRYPRLETIRGADPEEKMRAQDEMEYMERQLFDLIDDTQGDISDAYVLRGDSFADD